MFRANGKLLLTGEYFVLDGAKAIALPTKFGQSFKLREQSRGYDLTWKSKNQAGENWFEAKFSLYDFSAISTTDQELSDKLAQLLKACCKQNSDFLSTWKGYYVDSFLDYPLEWGLGSSASLISFLANWAGINPYLLLFDTLGGSGYDLACTTAEGPLFYTLAEDQLSIEHFDQCLPLADKMYFIYSGKKQSTEDEIKAYQKKAKPSNGMLKKISDISEEIGKTKKLNDLMSLIQDHENILADHLDKPPLQTKFSDFNGRVKSLGAWGGDFFLATTNQSKVDVTKYFVNKGYDTIFNYRDIIL